MGELATPGAMPTAADALWELYQIDLGLSGRPVFPQTRAQLESTVGKKLMVRYEYTRSAKNHPVTKLEDGRCGDCGTQYPPSHKLFKLKGSGAVHGCYTCGRLITFVTID